VLTEGLVVVFSGRILATVTIAAFDGEAPVFPLALDGEAPVLPLALDGKAPVLPLGC
jgi:hypothetical protein